LLPLIANCGIITTVDKENKMRGSIRTIIGFLIVLGAVGGAESVPDEQLFSMVIVAIMGLVVMASGINAMRESK
jgi:hypothetical protein